MEEFLRNVKTNLGGTLFSTKGSVPYVQMMWQMMNVASETGLATDYSRTKYKINRKKNVNEPE